MQLSKALNDWLSIVPKLVFQRPQELGDLYEKAKVRDPQIPKVLESLKRQKKKKLEKLMATMPENVLKIFNVFLERIFHANFDVVTFKGIKINGAEGKILLDSMRSVIYELLGSYKVRIYNDKVFAAMIMANIVEAAVKVNKKAPALDNPPENLTEKGTKLWKEFFKKYYQNKQRRNKVLDAELKYKKKGIPKKAWPDRLKTQSSRISLNRILDKIPKKYSIKSVSKEDQWAATIAFFRNYALKRNVYPFDERAGSAASETAEYTTKRFDSARKLLHSRSTTLLNKLLNSSATRVLKEKPIPANFNSKLAKWEVGTSVNIKVPSGYKNKELRLYLKKYGFKFGQGKAVYDTNLRGHKLVFVPVDDKTASLQLIMQFNQKQVEVATGKKDKSGITRQLSKMVKGYLTDNAIQLKAYVDLNAPMPIEFDDLSNIEQEKLDELLSEIEKMNTNDALARYTLDYIRSLAEPNFQYNLLKRLTSLLNSKQAPVPQSYKSAVDFPNEFLNPEVLADRLALLEKEE